VLKITLIEQWSDYFCDYKYNMIHCPGYSISEDTRWLLQNTYRVVQWALPSRVEGRRLHLHDVDTCQYIIIIEPV
jgi:hypothetical protein